MDKPSIEAVVERLAILERENRLRLWLGVGLFGITGALLIGGTDLIRRPKEIEAERFVLKDQEGRVRGLMQVGTDGTPSLSLVDPQGSHQVSIESSADGTSRFHIFDQGRARIAMVAGSDGSAALNVYDQRDRGASGLYVEPDGTAGIGLRNGKSDVRIAPQPDGRAGLRVVDQDGRTDGQVGTPVEPGGSRASRQVGLGDEPRRAADVAVTATTSGRRPAGRPSDFLEPRSDDSQRSSP